MTINYTSYVSELANMVPISSADSNFQTMLPGAIDYAEQRLYRELDLLYTQVTDTTTTVSSGNRNFTIPGSSTGGSGAFITIDNFNIITPSSATAANGSRVPLTPISPEFIDNFYPSGQSNTGTPEFYAMRSNTTVILGPAPDAAYPVELIGIQRPQSLSSANSSTFLTQYIPDLFMAASMVFVSGWMRDFGPMSDNPQQAQSWENQYQLLIKSAAVEQFRSKFGGRGWTTDPPNPINPPRG